MIYIVIQVPSKGTAFYRLYPLFSLWQVPRLINRLHMSFSLM